jgi:molecular chaperone DnaK (HSP70)
MEYQDTLIKLLTKEIHEKDKLIETLKKEIEASNKLKIANNEYINNLLEIQKNANSEKKLQKIQEILNEPESYITSSNDDNPSIVINGKIITRSTAIYNKLDNKLYYYYYVQ